MARVELVQLDRSQRKVSRSTMVAGRAAGDCQLDQQRHGGSPKVMTLQIQPVREPARHRSSGLPAVRRPALPATRAPASGEPGPAAHRRHRPRRAAARAGRRRPSRARRGHAAAVSGSSARRAAGHPPRRTSTRQHAGATPGRSTSATYASTPHAFRPHDRDAPEPSTTTDGGPNSEIRLFTDRFLPDRVSQCGVKTRDFHGRERSRLARRCRHQPPRPQRGHREHHAAQRHPLAARRARISRPSR